MTDAESFAALHGLSLEEAELILARRAQQAKPSLGGRLALAMKALAAAQTKVGVHPVVVQGSEVSKAFDEEAERNLERFYATKHGSGTTRPINPPPVAVEDVSQDPEDYR